MVLVYPCYAIILAALLCLAAPSPSVARCDGHDLFPALKTEAPASYGAIETEASEMPFRRGKLFRVSRPGAGPSYIFGTLHSSDPRVTNFSPRLRAALTQSKIVVLESIEMGDVLQRAIAQDPAAWRRATLARGDQRADRLLSAAEYTRLESLLGRKGLPKSAAQKLKPMALALLLDQPDCETGKPGAELYVDKLIANIARENKIKIVGLESIMEQLDVPDGLPLETERDLLATALRQADHGEDVAETAIARYIEGDIGGLLAWMQSAEPIPCVAKAQTPPAFLDRLITLRNYRMRDRALPLLKRGGAFIAVGAAHLPGKEGLLSLFEKAGYKVETVE
jgi:uncharacterized protein